MHFTRLQALPALFSCDTLAHPQQVSEYMPRLLRRRYLPLDLLEDTGMTGKPHRPSSTDGPSSVYSSLSIVLSSSTLAGYRRRMPVAIARRYRGTLPLGRCGD